MPPSTKKNISQSLLDYTIDRHFPESKNHENKALALLDQKKLQADLITHWMRVGFIHGVMNTDNMALCGETIDYGPCAFMDSFDPSTVFSSIDHQSRYAYANQPIMAHWNLTRLAESLLPLIDENREVAIELAEDSLKTFEKLYKSKWLVMMGNKLGLTKIKDRDEELITELLDLMHRYSTDYTNTFLDLGQKQLPAKEFYISEDFSKWHNRWFERLQQERGDSFALMRSVNPTVIPRNHKVEEALQAAEERNLEPLNKLLNSLNKPYQEDELKLPFQSPPESGSEPYRTFCGT